MVVVDDWRLWLEEGVREAGRVDLRLSDGGRMVSAVGCRPVERVVERCWSF